MTANQALRNGHTCKIHVRLVGDTNHSQEQGPHGRVLPGAEHAERKGLDQ